MKRVAIAAVLLLAGCKDKAREGPPAGSQGSGGVGPGTTSRAPSPVPPPPPGAAAAGAAAAAAPLPDVCRSSLVVLDQATCKTPEDRQRLVEPRKAISGLVEALGKVGGTDPRQTQVMCAQMVLAIEQDAAKLGCAVAIDAPRRKEITGLLDAWFGQRTPVTPTGDAAADAVIARIVAMRDAACDCRDAACLDRVDQQLAAIGQMPASAPPAARTLAGQLLEDAGRCAVRVRTMGPAAPR
jgi:hypothetical protein